MKQSSDPTKPRPTDNAFAGESLKGGSEEPTYSGALSFMRRRYSRDLSQADVAVWGIPFDAATSNRPGARFGPQGIRRASAIFDGDPQYPWGLDIFAQLAVIDYGDCSFDYGLPADIAKCIKAQASHILESNTHLFSMGGDHFVTYPLLQAHAEKYGPLALLQFDAHQDTWDDDGKRVDHGTFVGRAVEEGLIDPDKSLQIGIRTHAPKTCGIEIIDALSAHAMSASDLAARIAARTGGRNVYMTFDIDCLDPAFAPGTGTPVSGGFSSAQIMAIFQLLTDIEFVGGDVVEVAPAYDHADITSIAAATVAQMYMGLLATRRAKGL